MYHSDIPHVNIYPMLIYFTCLGTVFTDGIVSKSEIAAHKDVLAALAPSGNPSLIPTPLLLLLILFPSSPSPFSFFSSPPANVNSLSNHHLISPLLLYHIRIYSHGIHTPQPQPFNNVTWLLLLNGFVDENTPIWWNFSLSCWSNYSTKNWLRKMCSLNG